MIFTKIILAASVSVASLMSTLSFCDASAIEIEQSDIPQLKVQMVCLRGDIDDAKNKLPKTDNIKGLIDIVEQSQKTSSFKTYDFNAENRTLSIYDLEIRTSNVTMVSPNERKSSSKYSKTRTYDVPMILPSMNLWEQTTLENLIPCQRLQKIGYDANHIVTTLNAVFKDYKALIEFNAAQRINASSSMNVEPS